MFEHKLVEKKVVLNRIRHPKMKNLATRRTKSPETTDFVCLMCFNKVRYHTF
jgi:hypothetical protein